MSDVNPQDFNSIVDWSSDWTAHCARNGLTLQSSGTTVTCVDSRVTVSAPTLTGNVVTFRVTPSGFTSRQVVTVVVHVAFTSGATDERDFTITLTNLTS